MKTKSQYMTFVRQDVQGRKTPIANVINTRSGAHLGIIQWRGAWRQFCFYPSVGTVFNTTCMSEIQDAIAELAEEREDDLSA
jgi:hypothetical protein